MSHSKTPAKDINTTILTKMLQSDGDYVSGSDVADELGISRVSIWSHLEKLRTVGFDFDAIRNRGYKLTNLPQTLSPELIKAYLNLLNTEIPFVYLEETDSTNSDVERYFSSNPDAANVAVIAKGQTQGRGRLGRTWHSKADNTLSLSLGFHPNLPPQKLFTFTPWMATQICDLLNTELNLGLEVKWPNDLVYEGKKICGMLAESRVDIDHTRDIILGIGLNINGDLKSFPKELKDKATSIAAIKGKKQNINEIAAKLINKCLEAYDQFIQETYKEAFKTFWQKYDFLYDKKIEVLQQSKEPFSGTAKGISEEGSLKLLDGSGKITLLNAGEVSLRQNYSK